VNNTSDIFDGFVICIFSLDVGDDYALDLALILRESVDDEVNLGLGACAGRGCIRMGRISMIRPACNQRPERLTQLQLRILG
jgi:hypothetical protein